MLIFVTRVVILTLATVLIARSGAACYAGALPPRDLVNRATVIVLAKAVQARHLPPTIGTKDVVEFVVDETLKGSAPSGPLLLPGTISDWDDFNDGPVPYTFVRPGGRGGNCFATSYRQGGSFLLLFQSLRNGQKTPWEQLSGQSPSDSSRHDLTTSWAALAPTNEQVHGLDDPWIVWVRQRLALR
jgi:hypothetical protein